MNNGFFIDPGTKSSLSWNDQALSAAQQDRIVPRNWGDGPRPTSFAQERLWFLEYYDGNLSKSGISAYMMTLSAELNGDLQIPALQGALDNIIARHDVLNGYFKLAEQTEVSNPSPHKPFVLQEPGRSKSIELELVDLSQLSAKEAEKAATDISRKEALHNSDLRTGPLLHAKLLRLTPQRHWLIILIHHIAVDGVSLDVFVKELVVAYTALSAGEPIPLPPLPIQYADYAAWQRSGAQVQEQENQLDYWRRQLAGLPDLLDLPTDRPRPVMPSLRGNMHYFKIEMIEAMRLRKLMRMERASLFMVVLGAYQLFLGRLANQTDIAVGIPFSGRTHLETENLIGLFVNTLVIRAQLDNESSFRSYLAQIRETTLSAYTHQAVPFERIVQALQPNRDQSRPPLFQTMLTFRASEATTKPAELYQLSNGLTLAPLRLVTNTAKFDILLDAQENSDGSISCAFEYSSDLFDPETIQRFATNFTQLLDEIGRNPDRNLSEFGRRLDSNEEEILQGLSQGEPVIENAQAQPELLHLLFAAQAKDKPDATAIVQGSNWMSYAMLDRLSNRVARRLKAVGIGPDCYVGVCMERRPEVIVTLLGILKSGAAYLPLDPNYPVKRLHIMLEAAQAPLVISTRSVYDSGILSVTDATAETKVMLIEDLLREDAGATRQTDAPLPNSQIHPDNAAYILFTSGSTGTPKGVVSRHQSVTARMLWAKHVFGSALEAILASTSLSFDVSVFEIFSALSHGGRIVLIENALSIADRQNWHEATLVSVVPSAMRSLLADESNPEPLPPGAKTVCLAGERLEWPLVSRVLSLKNTERVFNLYGPTEDTIFSTFLIVHKSEQTSDGTLKTVTVGRPLTGSRIHILDKMLYPLPVGYRGILCIGGVGLTREYHRRPAMTAERFVPDPDGFGERIYITGDLCRWRNDKKIEYFGRLDHQVKINGFRIEIGDIEAALAATNLFTDAAVLALPGPTGLMRLVAYVAPQPGVTVDKASVISALRSRLPGYMVPGEVVFLTRLPQTPNGKIDRITLPNFTVTEAAKIEKRQQTPTEKILAEIWQQLLGRIVSIDDDFFQMGGHSLTAMYLLGIVKQRFKIDLPLRDIFDKPILQDQAKLIDDYQRQNKQANGLDLPQPRQSKGPLPLSLSQEQFWLLRQLRQRMINLPIAIEIRGQLESDLLHKALQLLGERHEILRSSFPVEANGVPIQVVHDDIVLDMSIEDFSASSIDQDGARLAQMRDAISMRILAEPFDLSLAPLMRVCLVRFSDDHHALFAAVDHIIADGLSMQILAEEWLSLYQALRQNVSLPPRPALQYADFTVWQQRVMVPELLADHLNGWKETLSNLPALTLPTDYERQIVSSFKSISQDIVVPEELSAGLRKLAQDNGTSLFATMLAVFQTFLARQSGHFDFGIGIPVANRTVPGIENMIGPFADLTAFRTEIPHFDITVNDLIKRVGKKAVTLFEHQDIPFYKVVEAINPDRQAGRNPLVQAVFNFNHAPKTPEPLTELSISALPLPDADFDFDIKLTITDSRQIEAVLTLHADLFRPETCKAFASNLLTLMQAFVVNPQNSLLHAVQASMPVCGLHVELCSSFTADPIIPMLRAWTERLHLQAHFNVIAHHGIIEHLLSQPIQLHDGATRFILLRLEDWGRRPSDRDTDDISSEPDLNMDLIAKQAEQLLSTLAARQSQQQGLCILALCPPNRARPAEAEQLRQLNQDLARRASILPNTRAIVIGDDILPASVCDPYLEKAASIPYNDLGFSELAARMMREFLTCKGQAYKVIVADCDGTLWQGICGEDGAAGVTVTAGHRLLQQRLAALTEKGILLCLCSRNNEADVEAVFENNPGMILRREHILTRRVNWQDKAANIASLAHELNLGLGSFVFLDDDDLECAKMRASHPGVLTIKVPDKAQDFEDFLARFTLFDTSTATSEDHQRLQSYRAETARQVVLQRMPSLGDFLKEMQLTVQLHPLLNADVERAVQLMQRTTQFNTTGLKHDAAHLHTLMSQSQSLCLMAQVSDRLGDYGKTALVLAQREQNALRVDFLAISCRVLGRNVEYKIIEQLLALARQTEATALSFSLKTTARNQPARQFIKDLYDLAGLDLSGHSGNDTPLIAFDQLDTALEQRAAILCKPILAPAVDNTGNLPANDRIGPLALAQAQFHRMMLEDFRNPEKLVGASTQVRKSRPMAQVLSTRDPNDPTEKLICSIWSEVLGLETIGVHADFFENGGHSLAAIRVLARVRDMFGVELPTTSIFENRDVASMAGLVKQMLLEQVHTMSEEDVRQSLV